MCFRSIEKDIKTGDSLVCGVDYFGVNLNSFLCGNLFLKRSMKICEFEKS